MTDAAEDALTGDAAEFVHVGAHPELTSRGRSLAPGDHVAAEELSGADQRLIDDGVLVDVASFDTTPEATHEPTKTELAERARELDIEGRSTMSADELRAAIAEREGGD